MRDVERFLVSPRADRDLRLRAATNGTLGSQLQVQFDPPGWYDFNYATFQAVARAVPGLLDRMMPGDVGAVLITNAEYQPHASTYIPTLNCAILRQLVIGRSAAADGRVVDYLRGRDVPLLYGKASNLLQLKRLFESDGAVSRIRPHVVLVSGERLYADQRKALADYFGCPVFDAYIATESGLIAVECASHTGLHVRSDAVRVEVLLPDGGIAPTGSGEIVVTSLLNHAHLFVRYLLGDRCEIARAECPCGFSGQTIVSLTGRDVTRFEWAGGEMVSASVEEFLTTLPLREFQVYQPGRRPPLLKWVPSRTDVESVGEVNDAIHDWLRERRLEADVVSTPLDWITPRGGKLRRFVRTEG
jgi:hypothetical protein